MTTQRQISQGYHPSPSLGSTSHRPSHTLHSGLLFQNQESASHLHPQIYQQHPPNKSQSPPLPPKEMIAPPPGRSGPMARGLKSVSFPRECLNRFTSIASINTARNRETCGLLLGKDKSGRYVVTTLLIPKQHATSDTCTMDEEELVMQFTEERSLIGLGWVYRHHCWWIGAQCLLVRFCQIHTHPTQSCLCFLDILGRPMT